MIHRQHQWQTTSAAGANDGYVKLWINDVLVDTLSGLDNDSRHVTKASIGAVAGLDTVSIAGTVYWDGFEARRGSHIGPLSFAPASKETSGRRAGGVGDPRRAGA
jgi:hypothetical protein